MQALSAPMLSRFQTKNKVKNLFAEKQQILEKRMLYIKEALKIQDINLTFF